MNSELTRDFTATAFVFWRGKVLLHKHKRLGMWLPCGGHIEPNELPDEAAVRECLEESGVPIELVPDYALTVKEPQQLVRPRGVQLEHITPTHQHIDLIYFARPIASYQGGFGVDDDSLAWYGQEDCAAMDLSEEVRAWLELLFQEMASE